MMIGESGTSHTGDKHYYYKCAGAKRKLGCKKKSAKKDFIERAAVVLTVNRVLKDEEIDRIADGILTLQASEDTTIPALKKQLADTERGIENMLNAIQQGVLTSSTKERLEALEMQRDDLKIAVLQAELQKPKYTKEQIVSWIGQFKYGDVNSREYQKRIIDTFVNSLYLFDDRLVITYNFKGGTETITLKDVEAVYGSDLKAMSPPTKRAFRKERPFLLVENEQREKRCAVRPSKSSARKRGGCISCSRFGAAKKDSGRHGANEVGGVPIAFLRRESAAFSAFHAENIRKCNRHGGDAAAGVARRLLPSLRPISSRISYLTSPDLAQIACKSGESVGGLKEARFCEKR